MIYWWHIVRLRVWWSTLFCEFTFTITTSTTITTTTITTTTSSISGDSSSSNSSSHCRSSNSTGTFIIYYFLFLHLLVTIAIVVVCFVLCCIFWFWFCYWKGLFSSVSNTNTIIKKYIRFYIFRICQEKTNVYMRKWPTYFQRKTIVKIYETTWIVSSYHVFLILVSSTNTLYMLNIYSFKKCTLNLP